MPNQLDSAGLQIKTADEILDTLIAGLQLIYGADINVSQNSPDGQLVNIFAQVVLDQLELLVQIYNSFAVENAFGVILDQRVALNGISRRPGTYTLQDVLVTVDRAITLPGLDADINNPDGVGFTVQDDAGTQFILAATHVFVVAGSATLSFRAKAIGQVETTPNTITNQVTTTLGVTSVNNPGDATSVGENEETDLALKIRRDRSFFLAATGPGDAVEAAILAVPLVTDAYVAENDTSGTVSGVPARSIWCIAEGGDDADVGQAIYSKKAPGCGMRGAVSAVITRPNGSTFTALFDRPILQNLYVRFSILPRATGITFDNTLIKTQLAAALVYKLGGTPNIGDVVVAMLTIAPQGILTDVQVSKNGTDWFDIVQPDTFQNKYVAAVARITIL